MTYSTAQHSTIYIRSQKKTDASIWEDFVTHWIATICAKVVITIRDLKQTHGWANRTIYAKCRKKLSLEKHVCNKKLDSNRMFDSCAKCNLRVKPATASTLQRPLNSSNTHYKFVILHKSMHPHTYIIHATRQCNWIFLMLQPREHERSYQLAVAFRMAVAGVPRRQPEHNRPNAPTHCSVRSFLVGGVGDVMWWPCCVWRWTRKCASLCYRRSEKFVSQQRNHGILL